MIRTAIEIVVSQFLLLGQNGTEATNPFTQAAADHAAEKEQESKTP